jgi:hypothetical protein
VRRAKRQRGGGRSRTQQRREGKEGAAPKNDKALSKLDKSIRNKLHVLDVFVPCQVLPSEHHLPSNLPGVSPRTGTESFFLRHQE